jgi:signal transduction histidine kinase
MLASGKEQTQELYEERLGGHFLVTVSPLRNEQGQLIGSVHVARDITQQKEMEEIFRQHAALQIQQRLAQDLHDSTMQSLYAVGLGLESCRQLFKRNPDQALARLGRCVEELNSAMQDIRTHVMQLRSGKPADKSDTGKGALLTVDIPLQNTGTSS